MRYMVMQYFCRGACFQSIQRQPARCADTCQQTRLSVVRTMPTDPPLSSYYSHCVRVRLWVKTIKAFRPQTATVRCTCACQTSNQAAFCLNIFKLLCIKLYTREFQTEHCKFVNVCEGFIWRYWRPSLNCKNKYPQT